jgi:hypothetical protein
MATWVFRRKPSDSGAQPWESDDGADGISPNVSAGRASCSLASLSRLDTVTLSSAARFKSFASRKTHKINPGDEDAADGTPGGSLDSPADEKMKGERLSSMYGRSSSGKNQKDDLPFNNTRGSFQLDPNNTFKRRWDITQAVILVYIALVVPFRVGYKQPSEGVLYGMDLIIDLYFYVDICFNFVTAGRCTSRMYKLNAVDPQRLQAPGFGFNP